MVQIAAQVVAGAIYTTAHTHTHITTLGKTEEDGDQEKKKVACGVRCLTVKETGNGGSVDTKGGCDRLVIALVLNAALWMVEER